MSSEPITPALRDEMRMRVVKYEQELRLDQSYAQPSQIIDREAVPVEVGQYTDDQIDRIVRIYAELSQTPDPSESDDVRLGRALQRFILCKP